MQESPRIRRPTICTTICQVLHISNEIFCAGRTGCFLTEALRHHLCPAELCQVLNHRLEYKPAELVLLLFSSRSVPTAAAEGPGWIYAAASGKVSRDPSASAVGMLRDSSASAVGMLRDPSASAIGMLRDPSASAVSRAGMGCGKRKEIRRARAGDLVADVAANGTWVPTNGRMHLADPPRQLAVLARQATYTSDPPDRILYSDRPGHTD